MLCASSSRRILVKRSRAPRRANLRSGRALSKSNRSCRSALAAACSPGKNRSLCTVAATKMRPCYQSNQQYSIIALTDESGTVTERYAYDAYGKPTVFDGAGNELAGGSAENNRYMYTGQEWDADLALYHFGGRMYDPWSGRFISRDPSGYSDGYSLYRLYIGLQHLDPTGRAIVTGPFQPTDGGDPWPDLPDDFPIVITPPPPPPPLVPPTTLISHGHYCGPDRRASCKDGAPSFPPNKQPIDDVDVACGFHDCCLNSRWKWCNSDHHKICNRLFEEMLRRADCSKSPDPPACEAYRRRALGLTIGTIDTPGVPPLP